MNISQEKKVDYTMFRAERRGNGDHGETLDDARVDTHLAQALSAIIAPEVYRDSTLRKELTREQKLQITEVLGRPGAQRMLQIRSDLFGNSRRAEKRTILTLTRIFSNPHIEAWAEQADEESLSTFSSELYSYPPDVVERIQEKLPQSADLFQDQQLAVPALRQLSTTLTQFETGYIDTDILEWLNVVIQPGNFALLQEAFQGNLEFSFRGFDNFCSRAVRGNILQLLDRPDIVHWMKNTDEHSFLLNGQLFALRWLFDGDRDLNQIMATFTWKEVIYLSANTSGSLDQYLRHPEVFRACVVNRNEFQTEYGKDWSSRLRGVLKIGEVLEMGNVWYTQWWPVFEQVLIKQFWEPTNPEEIALKERFSTLPIAEQKRITFKLAMVASKELVTRVIEFVQRKMESAGRTSPVSDELLQHVERVENPKHPLKPYRATGGYEIESAYPRLMVQTLSEDLTKDIFRLLHTIGIKKGDGMSTSGVPLETSPGPFVHPDTAQLIFGAWISAGLLDLHAEHNLTFHFNAADSGPWSATVNKSRTIRCSTG